MPGRLKAPAPPPTVAVVDYGMGNLFSVARACERAGLDPRITADPRDVVRADGVVLPGVGAFGDAVATLRETGLADALCTVAASGTPMLGVCLGLQLLMSESEEFGRHDGLGIVGGTVRRFAEPGWKVPHTGWAAVRQVRTGVSADVASGAPLAHVPDGAPMYFVHSYYIVPDDSAIVATTSDYAGVEFCSSVWAGSVFACQFHPERSGPDGLRIYANLAARIEAALLAREL